MNSKIKFEIKRIISGLKKVSFMEFDETESFDYILEVFLTFLIFETGLDINEAREMLKESYLEKVFPQYDENNQPIYSDSDIQKKKNEIDKKDLKEFIKQINDSEDFAKWMFQLYLDEMDE